MVNKSGDGPRIDMGSSNAANFDSELAKMHEQDKPSKLGQSALKKEETSTKSLKNHKFTFLSKAGNTVSDKFSRLGQLIKNLFSSKNKIVESDIYSNPQEKESALKKIDEKFNETPSLSELKEASSSKLSPAKIKEFEGTLDAAYAKAKSDGSNNLTENLLRIGNAKRQWRNELSKTTSKTPLESFRSEQHGRVDEKLKEMMELRAQVPRNQYNDNTIKAFDEKIGNIRNLINSYTSASNTHDIDKALRGLEEDILRMKADNNL